MSFVEDPARRLSHGHPALPFARHPREEIDRAVAVLFILGEPAGPGFLVRQAVARAHEGRVRRC